MELSEPIYFQDEPILFYVRNRLMKWKIMHKIIHYNKIMTNFLQILLIMFAILY